MRVVFFTFWGTIGETILEWMIEHTDDEVVAVVTRPGEQGATIRPIAFKYYIPYYEPPENVNDPAFIEVMRKLDPDLFVSMYFGRLFGPDLLAVPKLGCINMHPSLLPKYRGQGPSIWPLINGDTESGQTIHWLDAGIDSGDIISQRIVPITNDDTSSALGRKMLESGIELWKDTWPLISAGTAPRIPQDDSQAVYSVSPKRKHARIDWADTATKIRNVARAFTHPGQGAWARLSGQRIYIWEAQLVHEPLPAPDAQPGDVLGVNREGLIVQTGDGQLALTSAQAGQEGPELLAYLGSLPGVLPISFS